MIDPLSGVDDGDFKTVLLSHCNRRLSDLQRDTDEFPISAEYVTKIAWPGKTKFLMSPELTRNTIRALLK